MITIIGCILFFVYLFIEGVKEVRKDIREGYPAGYAIRTCGQFWIVGIVSLGAFINLTFLQ